MVRVERRLAEEGLKSKLVLQIHDELDLEVPNDEIDEASALVKETMEGVAKLRVPLIAEVSSGPTWADAK
jgi:DNA polymerase-1